MNDYQILLFLLSVVVRCVVGFTLNPSRNLKFYDSRLFSSISTSTWNAICTTDTEHFLFQNQTKEKQTQNPFYIRPANGDDIPQIVEITIDAFSNPTHDIRPYLVQSENLRYLNNLPNNDHVDHIMLVAVSSVDMKEKGQEIVIGFVDLDGRIPTTVKPSDPPKPYLSDLAVHINYRRLGIASALLNACEKLAKEWGHNHMYLRVEKNRNAIAKALYFSKGYTYIEHDYFGVQNRDDTMLLQLELSSLRNQ